MSDKLDKLCRPSIGKLGEAELRKSADPAIDRPPATIPGLITFIKDFRPAFEDLAANLRSFAADSERLAKDSGGTALAKFFSKSADDLTKAADAVGGMSSKFAEIIASLEIIHARENAISRFHQDRRLIVVDKSGRSEPLGAAGGNLSKSELLDLAFSRFTGDDWAIVMKKHAQH